MSIRRSGHLVTSNGESEAAGLRTGACAGRFGCSGGTALPRQTSRGLHRQVHAEGFAGFDGLFGAGKAAEQACTVHARREFVDEV